MTLVFIVIVLIIIGKLPGIIDALRSSKQDKSVIDTFMGNTPEEKLIRKYNNNQKGRY